MFGSVTEPNYRDFAFSPELLRHTSGVGAILEGVLTPWGGNEQITLTEQGVQSLIAASFITSPFVIQRPEFSAPRPVKPGIWAPPQDPTFSGKWGQPPQTEIPPEPKVRLKPIDLRLLGFPLSPINRAINEGRQRRAEERLAKEKEEWRQRLQAIQIKNQEAVSEFERKVHATSEYKACLAEYRRWLQAAERLEAEYQAALQRWNFLREAFDKDRESEIERLMQLQAACAEGKPEAVSQVVATAIENSNRWWKGKGDHLVRYDRETKTLLVNYEFPDVDKFAFCKPGAKDTLKSVAKTQRRELQERLVYGLALRVVFDLALITLEYPIDQIALNGHATFTDKTTGRERTAVILSLLVHPREVLGLRISHLDPKSAFKRLKGVMTADLSEHSPVVPIMTINKDDDRIVEAREILAGLRENENIAAMDWADFEHLIRELFEKMFVNNGIEVEITRASRDSGVDAIAFDPNPLTGGKYVIQAKRYTRTVDVSAVRDLFGTLQNEGANRGILVTTSKFGPDSYEFARGKPITLIDGPNLLGLLHQHGYKFTIDLEAARRSGLQA